MKKPILSIVVPVYNAQNLLERFFRSLECQTVYRKGIEILIVDGGSTDKTVEICKEHKGKIIHNEKRLAEPGVALGIQKAESDIIMVLALDNIFSSESDIEKIISVFEDKKVIAAFPKHDTDLNDSIYSRYYNTFTDPYTHFIYGNAANARTFHLVYKTLVHTTLYDVYDFASNPVFPVLALAQGFTVRKAFLKNRSDRFDDVLVIYNLIKQKKSIAYVHAVSLYHFTVDDFSVFIKKTRRAVENALLRGNSGISIRTKYLTSEQRMKRFIFFPYSLSIVFPLCVSVVRWIETGERAWFLHPYMVFLSAVVILYETIRLSVQKIIKTSINKV